MGEVLFEIRRIGVYAKASAIDAESGIEATVVGPARATNADLRELALRKLKLTLSATKKD
jgi:hypothetical protein